MLRIAHAARARGWRPIPLDHPHARGNAKDKDGNPTGCAGAHTNIPCDGERGKHPCGNWGTQSASVPTDGMLQIWFGNDPRNIGIACGPSGLVVLDEDEVGALERLAAKLGQTLPRTYRVRTARGWHYYFAAPADRVVGNRAGALKAHHIDVRGGKGGGGYVVGAGSLHASGRTYTAEDEDAPLAELPGWIIDLIDEASGDEPREGWSDDVRYGQAEDLLAQFERRLENVVTPGFRYSFFLAARDGWRLVNCGELDELGMLGRLRDAVQRVWGAGPDLWDRRIVYDEAKAAAEQSPWEVVADLPSVGTTEPPTSTPDPATDPNADSSWTPVDLDALWDGAREQRMPEILARTDGIAMFYTGLTHSVHGESESGKSWIGQSATVETLARGERVLYVDFEDRGEEVLPRLRALGVQREHLKNLDYITPDGPADGTFARLIEENDYALGVIDGVTAAMGEYRLKSNAQDDVTQWHKLLPRWIADRTGAAVVVIDHVSKSAERGRFAVGSQAKMAVLSGAGFYVDVARGLAPGGIGELRILVGKDRPGGVRANSGKMQRDRLQPFARYVHDATNPDRIAVEIVPWTEEDDGPAELRPLPRGAAWHDPEQPPMPTDIESYRGPGRQSIRDLARFLRVNANGVIGVTATDAVSALRTIKGTDGKPLHARDTVLRAWDAMVNELGRLEPADANLSDEGRTKNPRGLHLWTVKPLDPGAEA